MLPPPPELLPPPPPELLLAWVCGGFEFGLDASGRLGGATGFFLCDELAELGFGFDSRLLVLGGALLGLVLRVDERSGERFGFGDLVLEFLAVVFEIVDEGVEFVGADVTGAERDRASWSRWSTSLMSPVSSNSGPSGVVPEPTNERTAMSPRSARSSEVRLPWRRCRLRAR